MEQGHEIGIRIDHTLLQDATGTVSLRTFPKNFAGRSGTADDQVCLCSPETAVAAALFGKITDPRKLGEFPRVSDPDRYSTNDENLIFPPHDSSDVEIVMGPNIRPFPKFGLLADTMEGMIVFKVGDTTSLPTTSCLPGPTCCR